MAIFVNYAYIIIIIKASIFLLTRVVFICEIISQAEPSDVDSIRANCVDLIL